MATISEKNSRRFRIQFTMSRALYQAYEANLEQASKLQVVIDFSRDFEKWFSAQLEQVARELKQLETEQSPSETVKPDKQSTGRKSVSSTTSAPVQIPLTGGADHGDDHQ